MAGAMSGRGAGPIVGAALAALLLGTAACETDPNAPGRRGGGVGGGSGRADVSGDWIYNATNLATLGMSCNVSNVVLSLQQSDSTFTGTYAGGEIVCFVPGEPAEPREFGSGVVLNGLVRGDSVFFDLDTPDWRSRGRLSGTSISGETAVRINLGIDGEIFLLGPFGAVKQ